MALTGKDGLFFGGHRLPHVISSEPLPAPIPSEASGRLSLFLLIKHSSLAGKQLKRRPQV